MADIAAAGNAESTANRKEAAACAFLRGCIYIPERMCANIWDGVPEALSLRGEDDYF